MTNKEIDDAVDRIVAGLEGKPLVDGKAKSLVAYHEVGHAICGTLTPGHDPVQKVTLIPRGQVRRQCVPGGGGDVVVGGPTSVHSCRLILEVSILPLAAPRHEA